MESNEFLDECGVIRTKIQKKEEKLFRCSICEKEFDEMPSDGMHSVRGRYPTKGGDYIDVDGECGPVYEVEN